MLIDTHCHLNLLAKETFDERALTEQELKKIETIITEASQADITTIITVGTNIIESINSIAIAKTYPHVYAAIGIHPTDVLANWHADIDELKKLLTTHTTNNIVAIGETGLDLYHAKDTLSRQKDAFYAHIELALEHQLALIIHSRNAYDETLYCLERYRHEHIRGIIHCFSQDKKFAQQAIDFGYVLGIGGPLTYPKNDELRDIFTSIPLHKIVLETDAPFLPPQHIRGKKNHPREIHAIATYLAQLRSVSLEEVADTTSKTAQQLFNLQTI